MFHLETSFGTPAASSAGPEFRSLREFGSPNFSGVHSGIHSGILVCKRTNLIRACKVYESRASPASPAHRESNCYVSTKIVVLLKPIDVVSEVDMTKKMKCSTLVTKSSSGRRRIMFACDTVSRSTQSKTDVA